MKQLAQELEVDDLLEPGSTGNYKLPLEEDLAINITPLSKGFYLFCNITPCPKANREVFYSDALLANLFGQGTHGAILGLSEDGGRVTLSYAADYSVEYKEFRDSLEDFINTVDFWREEIRKNQ